MHSRRVCGAFRLAAGLLLAAAFPLTLDAAVTVYTAEAPFLAAGSPQYYESFEQLRVGSYGESATFGQLTFRSPPSSLVEVVSTGSYGAHNTTFGGAQFLQATGDSAYHDPMRIGHLGRPMLAWGASFTDLDFGTIQFSVDGEMVHAPPFGPDSNTMFVGFMSDVPFRQVMLVVNDRTYGIDDVHVQIIPEPGMATLALSGVLALLLRRRRRLSKGKDFTHRLGQFGRMG